MSDSTGFQVNQYWISGQSAELMVCQRLAGSSTHLLARMLGVGLSLPQVCKRGGADLDFMRTVGYSFGAGSLMADFLQHTQHTLTKER